MKGSGKIKISKRGSEISDLNETKQIFTIPSSNDLYGNKSVVTEEE